ncbi:YdcF family protein [Candidatus Thioglobus sp.]|uniref:YdcF family protein n=1 Tax=Candidatus Thioglobus sp. TaxID=2026721 RepID=UPI003D11B0EE
MSAGISLVASFIYVISIAKNKKCLTNNKAVTLLVLGKKLKNGLPDNEYMSRLSRAAGMLNNNPDRTVYILGGVTGVENIAESTSGKTILLSFGIDSNRIFLEKDSSHTLENLKNFYSLFNQKNQKILLVTNRYHMARSIMMAKGFKINATSCPAEDSFSYTFLNMGKVVIEAFYVNFYLAGKYWAILTNNNKVLDRISTINR